jgi:hypothetical protein
LREKPTPHYYLTIPSSKVMRGGIKQPYILALENLAGTGNFGIRKNKYYFNVNLRDKERLDDIFGRAIPKYYNNVWKLTFDDYYDDILVTGNIKNKEVQNMLFAYNPEFVEKTIHGFLLDYSSGLDLMEDLDDAKISYNITGELDLLMKSKKFPPLVETTPPSIREEVVVSFEPRELDNLIYVLDGVLTKLKIARGD